MYRKIINFFKICLYRLIDIVVTWQTIDWATMYRKIQKGNVVVDVGGYFGGFAIFASKRVGSKGKVICFEPDNVNYRILEERIRRQRIKNTLLIKRAISNRKDKVNLFSNFFYSSVCADYEKVKESAPIESIEIDTLDNQLDELGIKRIDFLKMNIEGAEIEAIEGAKNSLRNISYLVISSHKRNGDTVDVIEPILKGFGLQTKIKFGWRFGFHKKLYAWR